MSLASLQPLRSSFARLTVEQVPSTASSSVSVADPSTTAKNLNSTAYDSLLGQIAPTQSLGPDPSPEFITGINDSFKSLMIGLQGFPGEVVVQAELGKLILRKVNPKFITTDHKPQSFPSKDLLAQLVPGSAKAGKSGQAFFTNILTTLSTDANYLVDMKNQAGQPMWEKNAAESSIIYEIFCLGEGVSGGNPFTVEIDGTDFSMRIKTRYDFGSINVHGTLRHWDFSLVAFGFGDEEQNEKLYGDFARAIQRSLYIA